MRNFMLAALPLALIATPALSAKAVKVIEPLAPGTAGDVTVVGTTVTISDTARPNADRLEAKAAAKRAAAKLPPFDGVSAGTRPTAERYETLPLATMMPFEVDDVTRDWGLVAGRPIKLAIVIDTVKTADAGMAILLGSADELAGTVSVLDAASGAKLGEFYVDVLNASAGMLGLAMRGSGVREKLAAEFSKQIAGQLSGSKHKPKPKAS